MERGVVNDGCQGARNNHSPPHSGYTSRLLCQESLDPGSYGQARMNALLPAHLVGSRKIHVNRRCKQHSLLYGKKGD
ncbi:hypothetical protein Y1Q_0007920 [Alligator mississippiensis]|uniref:Uncharacterized protein n=1 Tax=Alligator mississippiensis TaxID=8496 RepID=A0A151NEV5_ALLMI|nr:hypothetical protein Y1Q_0007920 [Alligator mississippiensis]